MDLETFLHLPTEEVAQIVRAKGPLHCVFPNDGTRRWFMLEHTASISEDMFSDYMNIAVHRHIELYRAFFDHGVDTLLAPILGGDTTKRGSEYIEEFVVSGLLQFAENPEFLRFYNEYQVKVNFYGDYRKNLAALPQASHIFRTFENVCEQTRANTRFRLFFGMFANDATESIAELAIRFFQETGAIPDRKKLIELYYGDYIDAANIFIGFEKFCAFDYPLLATGLEDLYFMVSPSSYLEQKALRTILFDHLYTRRASDPDYQTLSPEEFDWWKDFYTTNKDVVLGTGVIKAGIWVANR